MIVIEFLNDGTLIKRYSDRGMMLLQNETGAKYAEAVDLVSSLYTYAETDEPVEGDEEITDDEALDIIFGGDA